ncbi:MAG: hypothetical protein JWM76_114 [Pseudonocardiales bacterium]|nr:hypothetical protein [Pseudonocardiales bacterium]
MSESYPPASGSNWSEPSYEGFASGDTITQEPVTTGSPTGYSATESSDDTGTAQVAKDQAASVGSGAAEAGQHVAGVAKEQVGQVATEAGRQAKDLINQARTELSTQGGAQQQRLASSLHSLGDELHSMAHNSDQSGVATDLAKQAAGKTKEVASWLESREPGDVLDEVKSFARQRPVAFLALAVGAGLVAGRLTRGFKDAPDELSASSTSASTPSASTPSASTPYSSAPSTSTPYVEPTALDVVPFASSQDSSSVEGVYDLDGR